MLPPFKFVFTLQTRSSLKITLPCVIYYQLSLLVMFPPPDSVRVSSWQDVDTFFSWN